jgi:hypothetical protein
MAEKLANFLHDGLIHIHDITENIDLKKTSPEYLKKQLPNDISKSYLKIQYPKNNPDNIDETFFSFLKSNDKFFSEMKIINLDGKEESLKSHLDEYFKTMHSKYNQDKLFYFYFQLVLMELYLNQHKIELPRKELKVQLESILKNQCILPKKSLKKCIGKNGDKIDVITMSKLGKNIEEHCKVEKDELEQCVWTNWSETHSSHNAKK